MDRDLRRLLELSGQLDETVTDDPHTNSEIERFIDGLGLEGEQRTQYTDILDAIYAAGPEGLTVPEWAANVRRLHPIGAEMMEMLKTAAKSPFVHRVGQGRYAWKGEPKTAPDETYSAEDEYAVGQQVNLASEAMRLIREHGELSEGEWATLLLQNVPGLSATAAHQYVGHFVQQFQGVLKPAGPQAWRYEEEPQRDSMDLFRELLRTRKPE